MLFFVVLEKILIPLYLSAQQNVCNTLMKKAFSLILYMEAGHI